MPDENPPIGGCWVLADCRWSWHGIDELLPFVAGLLADSHSVVLVPESRRAQFGLFEAGGIVVKAVSD